MRRLMPVHIFGKCGHHECSRTDERACYRQMESTYKFYLSFENSICDDYVTEKFFNILKYNVVPITFGGTNMSTVTPPHSSIDGIKFGSVRKLVRHLEALAKDDAAYASYFWWKDFYEVRNGEEDRAQPYCDLCKKLNDPEEPAKIYRNMHKWWVTQSHCRKVRTTND
jgi:alpha-1,3-fucosyltransferase